LFPAVRERDIKLAKLLLSKADIVNGVNAKNQSALHIAVQQDDIEMATFLLAEGANINCKDATGKTPLHLAVEAATKNKKYDMVQFLISKNANPKAKDIFGKSPEDYTKRNEKLLESLQKKVLPGRPSRPRDFTNMPKRAPAPTNNDQLTACKAFKATVVKFFNKAGNVTYDKTTPSIYEYLYTEEDKTTTVHDITSETYKAAEKATYTWIHLPANNVSPLYVI
ncbi:ankyrin repeat-containing domain protein, partial [Pyronema omphalodes]